MNDLILQSLRRQSEQLFQQVRRDLERNCPDGYLSSESSTVLLLLMLVWIQRKKGARWINVDVSPLQLVNELRELANSQPILRPVFLGEKLLEKVQPVALTWAVEEVRSLGQAAGDLASSLWDPAALPVLLNVPFALDPSLAALIGKLVHPVRNDQVYVPWENTGQIGAALANLKARVVVESPAPSAIVALIGMLYDEAWEIRQAHPIFEATGVLDPGNAKRYTAAAAFLPIGMRVDPERANRLFPEVFPERTTSVVVLGIRQLLASTQGRIVVAVQNSMLFSSGAEYNLRMELVARGMLRSVIAMPGGLLVGTHASFAVLVIDSLGGHQSVSFVNADSRRFRTSSSRTRSALINLEELIEMAGGELDGAEVARVSREQLLDNDGQLQVSRYVVSETVLRAQEILKRSRVAVLEDLVSFIRPPAVVSSKDAEKISDDDGMADESATVHEIGAADLPAYGYVTQPSRKVTLDPKARAGDQFLRPYDILLIVKGSVGKVGIVARDEETLEDRRWVAGQSAMVLRVRDPERCDPRALFMQLRSPFGQELLKRVTSGATIPLIQLKELRKLEVTVPPKDVERQAIEALDEESRIEGRISQLRAQQAQLADALWSMA